MQWYHSEPARVTPNKGYGPQFWETVYIFEVNRARKVKSNAHVAMSKKSDPVQFFFLGVAGEDYACPTSNFSKLPELSETSRARK